VVLTKTPMILKLVLYSKKKVSKCKECLSYMGDKDIKHSFSSLN